MDCFNKPVSRLKTASAKWNFDDEHILSFSIADSDYPTAPAVIKALKKRCDHGIFGYTRIDDEYRAIIVRWFAKRYRYQIQADWLVPTAGIVPSIALAIETFTNEGDAILIQPPVYNPFFDAVKNHCRNLILNQLVFSKGKWRMDLDSLRKIITPNTRMIIICNPHNPVGRVWDPEELRDLADICLKNDIIILSDEIHCDLVMPGYRHTPMASLSSKISSNTITCLSPSKTFNVAGLATSSVIISNPVLRKDFKAKIDHLHIGNGNIFGTVSSHAAYTNGSEWLSALLEYLEGNIEFVMEQCKEFIPEIIPVRPEATCLIWLDCRKLGMNGKELDEFFIRKAGVGLNEGSLYGPGGEGFMRMNIGTTRGRIAQAMEQIRKAVESIRT